LEGPTSKKAREREKVFQRSVGIRIGDRGGRQNALPMYVFLILPFSLEKRYRVFTHY
jgi:hypothetical protein